MPTITYKRLWCKKCNDWKLFSQHYPNPIEWFCKECETVHVSVKLKDVPEEKLVEQRKRYKESEKNQLNEFFGEIFLTPEQRQAKELIHMFSPPGSDIEIIESGAGQIEIDKIKRKRREKKYEEKKLQKQKNQEEIDKYKNINRNDLCPCGSGLKYKKCCLSKIRELENRN